MVGWALFLVLPFGREEKVEPPKTPVALPGEAELAAVGLRYNVDWVGLPEYFAIWADRAHWYQDKVRFAYWDSGSKAYDYFFEATREGKSVRFRAIARAEALEEEEGSHAREYLGSDPNMTEQERSEQYPAHPFVFMPLYARGRAYPLRTIVETPASELPQFAPKVPIDLPIETPSLPPSPGLRKSDDSPKK